MSLSRALTVLMSSTVVFIALAPAVFGQPPAPAAAAALGGTQWQLVVFRGGDGEIVKPDDGLKYTLAFDASGQVAARIDCNRGRGAWMSKGAGHIEFGPLALTRALCPPESLHDRIVRQWSSVGSYLIKDGHLFLGLNANGGVYEFAPLVVR